MALPVFEEIYDEPKVTATLPSFEEIYDEPKAVGFGEQMKREWTGPAVFEKAPLAGGLTGLFNQANYLEAKKRIGSGRAYPQKRLVLGQDKTSILMNRGRGVSVEQALAGKEFDSSTGHLLVPVSYEEDEEMVLSYERRKYVPKTTGGKVAAGVSALPTYMAEFALTGNIYETGKSIIPAGTTHKTLRSLFGWIAGSEARTLAMMPKVAEAVAERQLEVEIGYRPSEGIATSILKGWNTVLVENLSEVAGGKITKGFGAGLSKLPFGKKLVPALRETWIKVTGGTSAEFARRILTKGGYSNIIGEIGEERLATILHAIANTDDFGASKDAGISERLWAGIKQDFTLSNLGAETVVLSVPVLASRFAAKLQVPAKTPLVAPEITPVEAAGAKITAKPTGTAPKIGKNRFADNTTTEKESYLKLLYQNQADWITSVEGQTRYEEFKQSLKPAEKKDFKDVLGVLDKRISVVPPAVSEVPAPVAEKQRWELTREKARWRDIEARQERNFAVATAKGDLQRAIGKKKIFATGSEIQLAMNQDKIVKIGDRWAFKDKVTPEIQQATDNYEKTVREAETKYAKVSVPSPSVHYEEVKRAIKEGKPVPPKVLAEYPDLAKQATEAISTKEQRQQLGILARKKGMTEIERRDWLEKKVGIRSFTKLTSQQAQNLISELSVKPEVFTPEEAKRIPAKESVTDYVLTNQSQMGWKTPLPQKPELRDDTIKNMRILGNKQKKRAEHILSREEMNLDARSILNRAASMRYAVMSVEEKAGIPIYNRVQNAIYKADSAKLIPEEVIRKTIDDIKGDFSFLRLSVKDNRDMGNYLFSPEGKVKALKEISPQALRTIQSLEKLLQKPGPIANEAQLSRFILWDEYGIKPPDVAKYGDPKAILKEGRAAKKAGQLREWIEKQPAWGLRDFYYLSDNTHAGIMDAVLQRMARPTMTLQEGEVPTPANLPAEAFTREGSAQIRKGSVINNIIRHWEKLRIFNTVHDDMRAFYDVLDKAKPSRADKESFDTLWSNILQKGKPLSFPLDKIQTLRRNMWRMWLSPIGNTPTMLRMTLRNTLDVLHGLPLTNIKEIPSALIRLRTDPQFKEDFAKDWAGRVNQGRKKYKEFLLLDEGNISRDMPNSEALRKAGYYLDKSTVLYGMTDSLTRAPVYALEYEIVKSNAQKFINGKIDYKKFLANTNLDLMKIPQQEVIKHYLDEGNARMAAREAAVWATENSNFRYETTMRSFAEQTAVGRVIMGLYTYPKGMIEMAYQNGIKPVVLGLQTNRPGMAWRGAKEFTKLIGVTALKGIILKEVFGMSEDLLSSVFYSILDPALAMIHEFTKDFSSLWYYYRQGKMTLPEFLDKTGNLIGTSANPLLPLGLPMLFNTLESLTETKDLNAYRGIKHLLGGDMKLRKAYRTEYQKIIHALTGAYESPPKEKLEYK